MLEELLAQFGLRREQLNPEEIATLSNWAATIPNKLTLADVTVQLNALIEACERELAEPPKDITAWLYRKRRQAHLIARLQNYLMLRDFITKPERARKFVEEQLKRLAPRPKPQQ